MRYSLDAFGFDLTTITKDMFDIDIFKVRCMNFYGLRNGKFISDVGCPDILGILIQTVMFRP